jgi:hypothetical protein
LPDAHQPNRIESITGDAVPCRGGDGAQVQGATGFHRQIEQPCPSIYLVDRWVGWPRRYQAAPVRGSVNVQTSDVVESPKTFQTLAIHSPFKEPGQQILIVAVVTLPAGRVCAHE